MTLTSLDLDANNIGATGAILFIETAAKLKTFKVTEALDKDLFKTLYKDAGAGKKKGGKKGGKGKGKGKKGKKKK